MRVEPDLELTCRRRSRLRIHVGSLQVPRIVAADEIDQPLFPLDRNSAAAPARVISLSANLLFSHGSGVEVNGPGEIRQLHFWPVIPRGVSLAHNAHVAPGARIGDTFQRFSAHCFSGGLQNGLRILGRRSPAHQRQKDNDNRQFLCHTLPPSFLS